MFWPLPPFCTRDASQTVSNRDLIRISGFSTATLCSVYASFHKNSKGSVSAGGLCVIPAMKLNVRHLSQLRPVKSVEAIISKRPESRNGNN